MNRVLLAVAISAVLSGCSTLFPQQACAPEPPKPAVVAETPAPETEAQRQDRLMWELSTKSIYFDANVYSIKPEYQEFLAQVTKFLQAAPEVSIALIGNADERGHGQVVVGQKRADAVKQAFKALGLREGRIETVSLGDKNPRATCHEERCWAQNRRVDIVFLGAGSAAGK
jgi:peptidoglycan-associated lipoprotein